MKIDDSWYKKPNDINFPTKENAGGVVIGRKNNAILIALIRDRKFDKYGLPKGGIEAGENIITTAKREISEEAGFKDLNYICELGVRERLTFEKNKWAKTHYLLFTTIEENGTQNLQEEEDLEVKWFDVNNLPDFFWPEQKEIVEKNLEKIKSAI